MAGPCSVESRDQIERAADIVADGGAQVIRGGAFKPRSFALQFSGHGRRRPEADARGGRPARPAGDQRSDGSRRRFRCSAAYADILQVGARNMQNFNLLRELGKLRKPVLLKRGIAATIEELLLSAEYILSGGNYEVILCERGIRTFETYTRNTMDISAIPVVKKLSHLPMVADPSHGTGRRDHGAAMARAAVAAGRRRTADGSASRSRSCAERWRAVAVSRAVHRTDGAVAPDRRRGRRDHLELRIRSASSASA